MSKLLDAEEEQIEEHLDDLADHVMKCFDRAKRHRDDIGLTETLIDCLRRYRGKYDSEDICKFEGIQIYRGMTGMICRSAYNWLKDAYFNAQDRPWTLDPTPIPELPEEMREQLMEAINNQLQNQLSAGQLSSINSNERKRVIDTLKNTASKMAFEASAQSVKAMEKTIEDQLIEADWRDVLSEFLLDVIIYPYAILKGPVVKYKEIPVWNKNKYVFKKEPRYYVERIDPNNFYPSPDSTDCENGEYVVELMRMSRASLKNAAKLKGFDEDAINLTIEEQGHQYNRNMSIAVDDGEREDLDGVARTGNKTDGNMFDVYEYNGRISGDRIIDFIDEDGELDDALENFDTVETPWGEIDPYEDYECTIRVCNGNVIMARLNEKKPVPHRGYYSTGCFKVPGAFAHECIPMVLADLQDELNAAARSRMYNMGMSAGPIAEVDVSRFPDQEAPENIEPWSVYPVQSNTIQGNNAKPAITFTNVPNNANALTAVMEEVWDKGHRISGIPPYMYGDDRGSAQTLGAFSLQYAGATKGIKTIISNIDNDIIEKFIKQMYFFNMVYNDDDGIKSDATINVRGAAGLIAQEQRQARPLELLQALGPVLAQLQPETALALANETLSESGYDPQSLGASTGDAQSEAAARRVGVQQPQVDNRSSQAVNAAQGANVPAPPVRR